MGVYGKEPLSCNGHMEEKFLNKSIDPRLSCYSSNTSF